MRWWVLGVLVASPFIACTVLYEVTLREIGGLPAPYGMELRQDVALKYWEARGETVFDVERLLPWSPFVALASGRRTHGSQMAGAIASRFLGDRAGTTMVRIRERAALTVWLTRHWSAVELTRTDAAMTSFGLDPNAMGEEALSALMRKRRCPSCAETRRLLPSP